MSKLQTVIFLFRHGQTDLPYSASQEIDDQRHLTKEGTEQIEKVGQYLAAFAPTAIYSSPLHRTVETAEIIKQLAEIPSEIIRTNSLLEYYNAEGFATEQRNAKKFFADLAMTHAGEHIVCVSHQDPIAYFVSRLGFTASEIGRPLEMAEGYRLVFAGVVPVECQKISPAKVER